MYAISLLSNHRFAPSEIDAVMSHIGAVREPPGWTLERNERRLFIEVANEDIPYMFEDAELRDIAKLLGSTALGRLSVQFDLQEDEFEFRMAVALGKAIAERWPTVLDDHMGKTYIISPPGSANISS